jgi:putative membrane protein
MSDKLDRPFVIDAGPTPASEPAADPRQAPLVIETKDSRPVAPETVTSFEEVAQETLTRPSPRSAIWIQALLAGIAGLASVGAIDWVIGLFARSPWLGAIGAAFLVLTFSGAIVWVGREMSALARLQDVGRIRSLLDWSQLPSQRSELAERIEGSIRLLSNLDAYGSRISAWHARRAADLPVSDALELFEADMLASADKKAFSAARRAVRDAFGLVTLSPTGLTDTVLFVSRAMRLLREVAEIYGLRPSRASLALLGRRVLKDAGMVAVADVAGDMISGFVGEKVGGRLSTLAAEGTVGAQRMAKFSLLAIECCRPVRFHPERRPGLRSLLSQ